MRTDIRLTKKEEIYELRSSLNHIAEYLSAYRKNILGARKAIQKLILERKEVKARLRKLGGKVKPFR